MICNYSSSNCSFCNFLRFLRNFLFCYGPLKWKTLRAIELFDCLLTYGRIGNKTNQMRWYSVYYAEVAILPVLVAFPHLPSLPLSPPDIASTLFSNFLSAHHLPTPLRRQPFLPSSSPSLPHPRSPSSILK